MSPVRDAIFIYFPKPYALYCKRS